MKVKMDPLQAQKMIENAEPVKCKCGNEIFTQGVVRKKVSPLDPANTTGKPQQINIPILYCISCKKQFVV